MPRCRIVKPEFMVDERLAGLDPSARLYVLGAASLADSNGILENRPLRIRIASMPHDATNSDEVIGSLLRLGIFSMSEDGLYLRIEPFKSWFRSFPNEEKLLEPEEYVCGTQVEHGQASHKHMTSLVQASDKDKDKSKEKRKTTKITESPGMDLVETAFQHHPPRSRDGKPLPRGSRAATLPRIVRIASSEGMTAEDVRDVEIEYSRHPNVAGGYVQALEVFWGDSGRWLDCWLNVQNDRRKRETA